ncbi:MAG: multicomponent Na+:H+ antiporter subunit G [Gammaproteobacteria bacterium]|jgi:multicomponent Na+:H+ antiporter subunit G
MAWNEIVATVLLALGVFLALTGSLGMLRMPDFYSRLHPAGKNDSLGSVFVLVGLAFLVTDPIGDWLVLSKLGLIIAFLIMSAPTATHAITKAAFLEGLQPWTKPGDKQGVYKREGEPLHEEEDDHV